MSRYMKYRAHIGLLPVMRRMANIADNVCRLRRLQTMARIVDRVVPHVSGQQVAPHGKAAPAGIARVGAFGMVASALRAGYYPYGASRAADGVVRGLLSDRPASQPNDRLLSAQPALSIWAARYLGAS